MYKFRNVATKEDFKKSNEWADRKICLVEHPSKIQKVWNVKDRFGNEWNIIFSGRVDEWRICNVCNYPCDIPFSVEFLSHDREIEIVRAQKAGRNYKSDRFLKQFNQLVLMVNCYNIYGYLR